MWCVCGVGLVCVNVVCVVCVNVLCGVGLVNVVCVCGSGECGMWCV